MFEMPHGDSYLQGPPRQVPGFSSLHRMVEVLLAKRVPHDGRIIVLGAGGGLELRALARAQPQWTLLGVDPNAEMLALARNVSSSFRHQIQLVNGFIEDVPVQEFDAAISLLTFHFIPHEERTETLEAIRVRLKRGAPLITAHMSFPQDESARSLWISRHIAYSETPPERIEEARLALSAKLSVVDPTEEETMLRQAGFADVSQFYAGFTFRGLVSYAA